jgi:NTP pyrophosphatase (non-canonical NTP hydrolase)
MISEEQLSILRAALDLYGDDQQVDHLIEEMAELTQALMKSRRGWHHYRTHPVVEELADVLICIESLKIILSAGLMKEGGIDALISEEVGRKMIRLRERIREEHPEAFR